MPHAQPLLPAEAVIGFGDGEQESAADNQADERAHPPGRQKEAAHEADDDPWQRDHVRQDLVLQVRHEEYDQRARERHSQETKRREPVQEVAPDEHERRDYLDDRIHW